MGATRFPIRARATSLARMSRRLRASVIALLGAAALVITGAVPASAATTASWATWPGFSGVSGAYQGTVTLAGQPALSAAIRTDSVGGSGLGIISGASTWLAATTPVGAKYGSSRDQPYLNLRPKANNATSPSTTTYSFATPTAPSGWTFVLGDIDADQVRVSAVGPDGAQLTAAQLGYRGGFNYCDPAFVGKPSCTGDPLDIPSWNADTQTLVGNAAAVDTAGSAGWFEPSAPISSLTFTFQQRSGAPVYQTWFASIARDVTGTVTDQADGPLDGVGVRLIDRNGRVVAQTTTAGGGTYAFEGFLATDGYTVEAVPPAGKIAVGATRAPADLTTQDATAAFVVRDIVPVAVSGTARDDAGNPIAGATVTIAGVGSVTTDSNGAYLFDTVPVGVHTATITPPTGYAVTETPEPFEVPEGSETPITDQDFELVANPALGGTVTAGGVGVAGVTVTAIGPDGTVSTVTGADGAYSFPLLTPGDYSVSVVAPDGYLVSGSATRDEELVSDDLTDVDFALVPLGALEGLVATDVGDPVPGVTITIETPDGPVELTTDDGGVYGLGELAPGEYEVVLTVPDGYSAPGGTTASVVVGEDGAVETVPPFVLVPDEVLLGGLTGTVVDDSGDPVPGVTVTVDTPDGAVVLTTDADGSYGLGELAPGEYEVTVTVPDGYTAGGETTATAVVGDDGAIVTVPVFTLVADAVVPSRSPGPSASGDPAAPGSSGRLPSTGADAAPFLLIAGGLVVVGAAALVTARVVRRKRSRAE